MLERPHEENDPNRPQLFWDGFQWVVRGITPITQTFDLNTKPGRKVQIANLPLHLNITVKDLKDYIYEKLVMQDLLDEDQKNIIKAVDLDTSQNAAVLVMTSIEDAKRVQILDGISMLGYTLRISPFNEQVNSNSNSGKLTIGGSLALANTAHLSAKSAAIAYAAFQNFSKNDTVHSVNSQSNISTVANCILRLI